MVYDIERGKAHRHFAAAVADRHLHRLVALRREFFKHHRYKSAATVIRMLADIVSKNGNLMLSVPLRATASRTTKSKSSAKSARG
jgi:alpha-L-fucosidase